MQSLAFLEQVAHDRKAAIYAAEHDGKVRNFAYHEGLGECREMFSRLLQDVQEGEIGVVMTPDAACLTIETSPDWMEAFIQAVKQHEVLIGDHSHDLVYDLRDEDDEEQFRDLYPQGEYEKARGAPRPLVDAIAQSPFAAAYIERGENWFLVTDVEKKAQDTPLYCLSSGARKDGNEEEATHERAVPPHARRVPVDKSGACPRRSSRRGLRPPLCLDRRGAPAGG